MLGVVLYTIWLVICGLIIDNLQTNKKSLILTIGGSFLFGTFSFMIIFFAKEKYFPSKVTEKQISIGDKKTASNSQSQLNLKNIDADKNNSIQKNDVLENKLCSLEVMAGKKFGEKYPIDPMEHLAELNKFIERLSKITVFGEPPKIDKRNYEFKWERNEIKMKAWYPGRPFYLMMIDFSAESKTKNAKELSKSLANLIVQTFNVCNSEIRWEKYENRFAEVIEERGDSEFNGYASSVQGIPYNASGFLYFGSAYHPKPPEINLNLRINHGMAQ